MEKFLFTLIFIYSIINPIFPTTHFESSQRYLHVYNDASELDKPLVIKSGQLDAAEGIHQRYRRDLPSSINENLKNISTKVNTQTAQKLFALISTRCLCDKQGEKTFCVISISLRAPGSGSSCWIFSCDVGSWIIKK